MNQRVQHLPEEASAEDGVDVSDDGAASENALESLALSESEARYRAALKAGRLGSWETDFQRGRRIWTDEGLALFGLTLPGNLGSVGRDDDEWLLAIHPDDRELALSTRKMADKLDSFPAEYRIKKPDGEVVWLSGRGQVSERDETGRPVRLVSIMGDISERKRTEAALRASESRFRSIFENVAVGMAYSDIDGRWLLVNQKLCALLGYDEAAFLNSRIDVLDPDDEPGRDLAEMTRLLSGDGENSAFEARYRHRDGSDVWVGRTISLVRGEEGQPQHFISVFRDISKRRQAEEHQRFLLSELSHRSKNLLAVIQALASQTIRSVGDLASFRERFMSRLQGLATTQDILVSQNWVAGDLAQLAAGQLDLFNAFGDGRILIDGPPVSLTADAAQAVGLALHELATNAIKYGALSAPKGSVMLKWHVERRDDETLLQVSWTERDGPAVRAPQRTGFGSVVLNRMVSSAVGGSVSIDYPETGVIWRLSIPDRSFVAR